MTIDDIDWSKLPPSNYGFDEIFREIGKAEITKLEHVHGAIKKWRDIAVKETEEFAAEVAGNSNPVLHDFNYDPVEDEAFMLDTTEQALFASLAVGIASATESFVTALCEFLNVPLVNEDGESDFGIIKTNLEKRLGVELHTLPGYAGSQKARLLGNCYKHNKGLSGAELFRKYQIPMGETISYSTQDWDWMIADTDKLLEKLASLIKP